MHHIVTDGWSIEPAACANSAHAVRRLRRRASPIRCRHCRSSTPTTPCGSAAGSMVAVLQRQLDFWRDHLEGAPALLALPTDHPRPALQDYRGDSVDLTPRCAISPRP
ncbi:hypothetical protein [Xanthomonas translucens]|uniref:hypothetical protein n=1 Tax=Xanthomonas campestris pv. translucens TaxID=343 RepID=UPI001F325F88|nr:hypothetical protein [Xanthomonas translucens]UKE59831.1 hypothetical protein KFS86_09505 [Xanthomonas translucens pv. hordei]